MEGGSKVPYMAVVHVLFPATSEGPTDVGLLVDQHISSVPPQCTGDNKGRGVVNTCRLQQCHHCIDY